MDAKKHWQIVQNMIWGRFTTDYNENHDPETGRFTSGSSYTNQSGAKVERLEPDNNNRVQFSVTGPSGSGRIHSVESEETFNKFLEQNGYQSEEDINAQVEEYLEDQWGEEFGDIYNVGDPYEEDGLTMVDVEYSIYDNDGRRRSRSSSVVVNAGSRKPTDSGHKQLERISNQSGWWGRRSEIEEELSDNGFEVLESNAEYITVAKGDKEYQCRLGGTERTITIENIRDI